MAIKPILFNTEMVKSILDERKTVTRRIIKPQQLRVLDSQYHREHPKVSDKVLIEKLCEPPYKHGDYLYVRETWGIKQINNCYANSGETCPYKSCEDANGACFPSIYIYKASDCLPNGSKWRPSIHMPKKASRIFLRVKDVRAERLQEIDNEGALQEGVDGRCSEPTDGALSDCQKDYDFSVERFMTVWDSTVKPKDRDKYGWNANPWVWVIEFERCEKPVEE